MGTTNKPSEPKCSLVEYTLKNGQLCPYCLDQNVEGGPVTIDNCKAYQSITCQDCEATWMDIYELTHLDLSYM